MCFSEEVSIVSYLVGMAGSLGLWRAGFAPEALFYLVTVQMQLVEFLIWRQGGCNDANREATRAGELINHAEPLVLWGALVAAGRELPWWVHAAGCAYLAAAVRYTGHAAEANAGCTELDSRGRNLVWSWNYRRGYGWFYAFFVAVLALMAACGTPGVATLNALVVAGSFALSWLVYRRTHLTGNMWCLTAAGAPWLLLYAVATWSL